MIKRINNENCKNNLIQLYTRTSNIHLIINEGEIALLKIGNNVLINKCDLMDMNVIRYKENFTQLFEYNKMYLQYHSLLGGYGFHNDYFFKVDNNSYVYEKALCIDDRKAEYEPRLMSREEIENYFNIEENDYTFLIDGNGFIIFARSIKDNLNIGTNIIPTDEEIIDLELKKRRCQKLAINFSNADKRLKDIEDELNPKAIDEITNLRVYSPFLLGNYCHILITSKNGNISLNWINLKYIKQDKFELAIYPINIPKLSLQDLTEYVQNHEIKSLSDEANDTLFNEEIGTIKLIKAIKK